MISTNPPPLKVYIEQNYGRIIVQHETPHYACFITKQEKSPYDWTNILVISEKTDNESGFEVDVPFIMPALGVLSPMDYLRMVGDYYERLWTKENITNNLLANRKFDTEGDYNWSYFEDEKVTPDLGLADSEMRAKTAFEFHAASVPTARQFTWDSVNEETRQFWRDLIARTEPKSIQHRPAWYGKLLRDLEVYRDQELNVSICHVENLIYRVSDNDVEINTGASWVYKDYANKVTDILPYFYSNHLLLILRDLVIMSTSESNLARLMSSYYVMYKRGELE